MLVENDVIEMMQKCASELFEGNIIDSDIQISGDTVLMGSDSPLDSIGFVTFITELEDVINDKTGKDLSISLMEVEDFDENVPSITASKLARYIVREING